MNILVQYLQWHFFDIPKEIFKGWKNFLRFNLNYWSLPLLFKTFFSHWRKYRSAYAKGFDIKNLIEVFTFNSISRIIGAILRTLFIIISLFFEIALFVLGLAVILLWFFLPFLLIAGIVFGFKLIT